ncbi:MAG: pyruvate kinase, partial [Bullifex sp.]|nr:pyruvate kinase [Bullifex sp.]
MRKTKIICTIGPAVESEEKIRALIAAGMDAARFNFSHGSHEEHKKRIDLVKKVSEEMNSPVALILDTKGPEIRVGDFTEKKVELTEGQTFTLYRDLSHPGDVNGVGITYPYLSEDVTPGTTILIDDGLISMTVNEVVNGDMVCTVNNGGKVSSKKSINIPGVDVDQVFISEKDRSDIIFGIEQDIDFIAASFVRNQEDVKKLRKLLNVNGGEKVQIIAKIENGSGIENLDKIIEIADGVMIARGDMGVEVPFDHLPAIQKNIIKTCYKKGRIVITATQMLDSMQEHPRPTRAEVSDVANAIYDG